MCGLSNLQLIYVNYYESNINVFIITKIYNCVGHLRMSAEDVSLDKILH